MENKKWRLEWYIYNGICWLLCKNNDEKLYYLIEIVVLEVW